MPLAPWLNHLKSKPVLDRKVRQIWMVLEQSYDVHVRTVPHSLACYDRPLEGSVLRFAAPSC
jgi:hypothetical protein